MKYIFKLILSAVILFGAVPTVNAMEMNMAGMEEIKKRKKPKRREWKKVIRKRKKVSFQKSSVLSSTQL